MSNDDTDAKFRIRHFVCQLALEKGISVNPDRIDIEVVKDAVRAVFHVATLEDEVFDYPENFLTRWATLWQRLKIKWFPKFPKWFTKRYPFVYNRVWVISKFPELNLPREFNTAEFIHFRVIKETKEPS